MAILMYKSFKKFNKRKWMQFSFVGTDISPSSLTLFLAYIFDPARNRVKKTSNHNCFYDISF